MGVHMDAHMGDHMENENVNEKENESEDIDMKGTTWKKVCPRCGSTHTEKHTMPYWGKCMTCGFESMGNEESIIKATDAWNNGYADIEDKASHEGIENFDHDELLDLWWYWVGMEGATDMGMQPEDVDWYWDEHPQELKETMQEMSKSFLWYHAGYFTTADMEETERM